MCDRWFFHNWSKWKVSNPIQHECPNQRRDCSKCNRYQIRNSRIPVNEFILFTW